MAANQPVYAPLPARAMVDMRLSERHLRTLAVVAAHDRLGKNGIGCWASHQRLAEMVGCHYTRLSHNLRELGELGYIERVQHPLDKKLRVYKVLYTAEDAAVMKATAKAIARDDSCPNGQVSDEPIVAQTGNSDGGIVAQSGNPDADVVAHQNQEVADSVQEPPHNIFRETGNRLRETLERDSVETARSCERAPRGEVNEGVSLDARLAIIERRLKEMKRQPSVDDVPILERFEEWLTSIADEHDSHTGDPAGGRALRLVEEIGVILEMHQQ
jgi:DNA-binding MarR family transcriptional regulator